jgi:D-alanine-D-alanine ligase
MLTNMIKTTKKKIRVAVLFGGKSAEHEVSTQSAKNVVHSLDKDKYEPVLIGIDKKGVWHQLQENFLLESSFSHQKLLDNDSSEVSLVVKNGNSLVLSSGPTNFETVDVVFPVLHGTFGEDGTVQGALQLMNIPYVGSGVLGSAVGMDKDVTKRLLHEAGLPIAKFLIFRKGDTIDFEEVKKKLGLPFFVKATNLGSSVTVNKVHKIEEFLPAIEEAFLFSTKIIIEKTIVGREIEIAVLGNDDPIVSIPGEIIPTHGHEFYDYEAKYFDDKGALLEVPAKMPEEKVKELQELAKIVFQTLCLEGMARIDFFLSKDGTFYVNEANTIPGFTNISMYPKMWESSGISYTELVDRLIQLAIDRHNRQETLRTSI